MADPLDKMVEVHNITRRFGDFVAVDQVSFDVMAGEIFGFLGPNGAGKTTLIRMLTTLLRPTSGGARVAGVEVVENPGAVQHAIGVVIMAIFLGALTTGAFNLVMDRFLGVDESYLLTPLSKTDIVGGLIVSGLLITTVMAFVIFVASMLITGIPLSHWLGKSAMVLCIIVVTTLGLQSFMFSILGQFHHPRIVGILSGFLNVILFFPSGAVYPVASFPGWLKGFAKINPEAYAVHALKAVLFKDAGFGAIMGDLLFLLFFTGIMLVLAVATFRRAQ